MRRIIRKLLGLSSSDCNGDCSNTKHYKELYETRTADRFEDKQKNSELKSENQELKSENEDLKQ